MTFQCLVHPRRAYPCYYPWTVQWQHSWSRRVSRGACRTYGSLACRQL